MSKRTIALEFEFAVQASEANDENDNKLAQYTVRPVKDHDFWKVYFEDPSKLTLIVNILTEMPQEHALKIMALRLHDVASGKSLRHGVDVSVGDHATFKNAEGTEITVQVPKMQNL